MQMNIQEFATAVLEELPDHLLCISTIHNLGMVRQWQKLFYGKRYCHDLTCEQEQHDKRDKCGEVPCPEYTPNFLKLAESYGAKGIRVSKVEEIEPAFRRSNAE